MKIQLYTLETSSENQNEITKEDVEAKIDWFKQMITSENSYLIRELMHEMVVVEADKDEIELRFNLGSVFRINYLTYVIKNANRREVKHSIVLM
ncbi:hypothetical protein KHQ82_00495 [Mycoplasmatota bacterium]|nr:hypothetical protein KHQ82_00495 [Mycoplasmatota bacterium]